MKKIISSPNAPAAIGPYSQAIEAGGLLFVSGQLPVDPVSGTIPETIELQTRQCFANISAILSEAGYTINDIVKATVLLDDIGNFDAMNKIYGTYFPDMKPARVCYEVSKLPKNVKVEIEVIANH